MNFLLNDLIHKQCDGIFMAQLEIKHIIPLNSNINVLVKGAFTILEANGTRVKGFFSTIAHDKHHSHVGLLL